MSNYHIGYTPHNLRELMRRHGLTKQATADALGVSLRTVFRWATDPGKDHRPMPHTAWLELTSQYQP